MAEPENMEDDAVLLESFKNFDFDEFDFSDKEELFSPESENLFGDISASRYEKHLSFNILAQAMMS